MPICHMCRGAYRVQRKVWGPLESEFQAAVSPLTRVLGTELRSAGRAEGLVTAELSSLGL